MTFDIDSFDMRIRSKCFQFSGLSKPIVQLLLRDEQNKKSTIKKVATDAVDVNDFLCVPFYEGEISELVKKEFIFPEN